MLGKFDLYQTTTQHNKDRNLGSLFSICTVNTDVHAMVIIIDETDGRSGSKLLYAIILNWLLYRTAVPQ